MALIKARNPTTGETIHFQWDGSEPPNSDDIQRISDKQRAGRIAMNEKNKQNEPGLVDKILLSPVANGVSWGLDHLGLNQPWHPIQGMGEMGEGAQQLIKGTGPEENPRIAGGLKIVKGAMHTFGPPATAVGYALAPIPTAAAMASGSLASEGTQAGLDYAAPNMSPEVKEALSTSAGLLVGGLAGHGLSRVAAPPRPFPIQPKSGTVSPVGPRGLGAGAPISTRGQLPSGPEMVPPAPAPPWIPRMIGMGDEPQAPNGPQYGQQVGNPPLQPLPELPPAPGMRALAPPGANPIELPPASIPMPPAGTAEAANAQMQRVNWGEQNLAPMAQRQLPVPAPPDLVSDAPATGPSEVSTISPAEGSSPKAAESTGVVVPTPTAPVEPQAPTAPVPPPPVAAAPQIAPPNARAIRPPMQVLPPQVSAPAPPAPPAAPKTIDIPPVQPPTPTPLDIAKAAMARVPPLQPKPTIQLPPSTAPVVSTAPVEPVKSQAPPTVIPRAPDTTNATNGVLDLFKRRRELTIDQIQTQLGLTKDQTATSLADLAKRGLIERKGSKLVYKSVSGEELPAVEAPTPKTAPGNVAPIGAVAPKITPKTPVETGVVSGPRVTRMKELQDEIGRAEDEGDDSSVKLLRSHLEGEEKNAQIEKSGTKSQRAIVSEMDNVSKQIDNIESKDDPSKQEQGTLSALYRRMNKLEQDRDLSLRPESEKYGPRVANMRSVHAEAQLSKLSHVDLSKRAKADFGVKSMSELSPEQLGQFEGTLRQERESKTEEISKLEEKDMDGTATPEEKGKLKQFWEDEGGFYVHGSIGKVFRDLGRKLASKGLDKGYLRKGWTQSGDTVLSREGGKDLADDIRSMRTEGEKHAGGLVADYHANIKGLNDTEFQSFMGVLQGTGRAINAKVARAAQIESARMQKVEGQLGKQTVNLDPVTSSRADKALLSDYYTSAARKIEEHTSFGDRKGRLPKDVNTAIVDIKNKGGDYKTAYRIADAYFNPDRLSQAQQSIWDKMAGFEVASKLGLSVISNATQPVNVALVTGNYTALKSLAQAITNRASTADLALRAGSTLSSVTHETQMTSGVKPEGFSAKMLEYTGFSPVEVNNRITASMAGAEHAVNMFNKLKKNPNSAFARRHLSHWLGLDPDVLVSQQKLTMDQVLTAAHTLTDRTQFRTTPLEIPHQWGSTLESKMVTLFKNFAFNQSKFMKDVLVGELGAGNMRPLIPLLTAMPIIGTLADRLKRAISGREQPKEFWDTILGAYSTVGGLGIISDLAARAAYGKLASAVAGPMVGDAVDFVESIFKGKKAVAKDLTRQIPVVGRPVANRLFPAAQH